MFSFGLSHHLIVSTIIVHTLRLWVLFNGDLFTDTEKLAYEVKVLTARRKLGHKGHTEAVRWIAKALGINLKKTASELGQRAGAEVVALMNATFQVFTLKTEEACLSVRIVMAIFY
jgi:hypothetical protein